ncbi:hypothetical protein BS47DRAFT_1363801 [Hydnum rufescens UP504]|uniref:Uncharacterized protein n=1 Tax=Hydnum rufescens UP504 TaxID=1448309 RepID=A0A9P6AT59_9AGAM|nr:hypothetical protein BS47DRAFT_1363801 [Hydnum rufescens UP504]
MAIFSSVLLPFLGCLSCNIFLASWLGMVHHHCKVHEEHMMTNMSGIDLPNYRNHPGPSGSSNVDKSDPFGAPGTDLSLDNLQNYKHPWSFGNSGTADELVPPSEHNTSLPPDEFSAADETEGVTWIEETILGAAQWYGKGIGDWERLLSQEDPLFPFKPWADEEEFEVIAWLLTEGLSQAAIDHFLKLSYIQKHPFSFRSAKEMNSHIEGHMPHAPLWKSAGVVLPEAPNEPCHFFAMILWRDLWWEHQESLPIGTTILAIQIASDKTHFRLVSNIGHYLVPK